jgi:8-oxo-dGTP pyrophosphatase MutT (NUDIX family)
MTHRNTLHQALTEYRATWAAGHNPYLGLLPEEESRSVSTMLEFLTRTPNCFVRSNASGHFTGSALVTDPTLMMVLLTHHRSLDLWLQLGGHADGHHLLDEVALREASEESGLTDLTFLDALRRPFDIDVHQIPARRCEPEHYHYDVRYLIVADPAIPLTITEESKDLRWLSLAAARQLTSERSMQRQFAKLDWLRTTRPCRNAIVANHSQTIPEY